MTLAAGVLIDGDHAPDLWWTYALRRQPSATYLLHSWEWLVGLVLLGIWTGFPWWMAALVVGHGLHVTTDHIFNKGGPWSYSLLYRARHGFVLPRVAPGWDHDRSFEVLRSEFPLAARLIEWWRKRTDLKPPHSGANLGEGKHISVAQGDTDN